jgi:hypothetical protein
MIYVPMKDQVSSALMLPPSKSNSTQNIGVLEHLAGEDKKVIHFKNNAIICSKRKA